MMQRLALLCLLRLLRGWTPVLVLLVGLLAKVPAQSWPARGDIGVVTDKGLYVVTPQSQAGATLVAAASAFGGNLDSPAMTWDRPSRAFLLVTGTRLYKVLILGKPPTPTAVIQDLKIPTASGSQLVDLSLDHKKYPRSLVVAQASQITRYTLSTGQTKVMSFLSQADGLDESPINDAGSFVCVFRTGAIRRLFDGNAGVTANLNLYGGCAPATGPRDLEMSPGHRRLVVLNETTTNCLPGAVGPNHLIAFPPALHPLIPPKLLTRPAGSGIAGKDGDIAVVHLDFAFATPYGLGCSAGTTPILDAGNPTVPAPNFTLSVLGAPPNAVTGLLLGLRRIQLPLLGCHLLTSTDLLVQLPNTNGQGKLSLKIPIPNDKALLGLDAYAQAVFLPLLASPWLSQGLRLHFGL